LYTIALIIGIILAIFVIVLFFKLTLKKKQIPADKTPVEKSKEQEALKPPAETARKELPPGTENKTPDKPQEKPPEKPTEIPPEKTQAKIDPAQPSKPDQEIQKTDVTNILEGKI
jgi:hypothetical protein